MALSIFNSFKTTVYITLNLVRHSIKKLPIPKQKTSSFAVYFLGINKHNTCTTFDQLKWVSYISDSIIRLQNSSIILETKKHNLINEYNY